MSTITKTHWSVVLDRYYVDLLRDQDSIDPTMYEIISRLNEFRKEHSPTEWNDGIRQSIVAHPIRNVLHQDPLTRRCFEKPRGYAGDAVMLDYIYGRIPDNHVTELGRKILSHNLLHPGCRGIRYRRDFMATMIDQVALERKNARIFSLACGHLREAALSEAVKYGNLFELVALDQDEESLSAIRAELPLPYIKPIRGSVKELIKGIYSLGTFDFIYASGLYDYLSQPAARRLTSCLFKMLKSGGILLVPNAVPELSDSGYMETFMDWMLIYRDVDMLADIAADIPAEDVVSQKTFSEPNGVFVFLEIRRA